MNGILTEEQKKGLTEGDRRKIRKELWNIANVDKPVVLKSLNEARAQGDLSENAEYSAAKAKLRAMEGRERYLERNLDICPVFVDTAGDDEVGMDDTVTLHSEKTGRDMTIKIVTWIRVNPLARKVSVASPMGFAVYKHKVGERVPVMLDSGELYYVTILAIDKTTDDSDDEINSY